MLFFFKKIFLPPHLQVSSLYEYKHSAKSMQRVPALRNLKICPEDHIACMSNHAGELLIWGFCSFVYHSFDYR